MPPPPMNLSRRDAFVAASLALLGGCTPRQPMSRDLGLRQALVDVHCHCFNATDIPARSFLKRVFLHLSERQGRDQTVDLRDGDVVDRLLDLFVGYIAADAPTAAQETEALANGQLDGRAGDEAAHVQAVMESITAFMAGEPPRRPGATDPGRSEEGRGKVLRGLIVAAGSRRTQGLTGAAAAAATAEPASRSEQEDIAARALFSDTLIGRYLRWFGLFSRYRHSLVDELAETDEANGGGARMLCPAMVDYSHWLDEEVQSPLIDQVRLWGRISARPTGPAVHGYVAFDPLREIYRPGSGLDVVREALDGHGFLGVKVYPPMGFRAWNNADAELTYPDRVIRDLGPNLGRRIDAALASLYAVCIERDAPILAHCSPGNEAATGYGIRADPWYWGQALAAHPGLRVCLAHYGGFAHRSVAPGPDGRMPQASWEWAAGGVENAPGRSLFLDISYFTEAQRSRSARRATARSIRGWLDRFDRNCEALVFGTDWIMLASEKNSERYVGQVLEFLRKDLLLTPEEVQRVFHDNALRFAGLSASGERRRRLLNFYEANGLDPARLPLLGA